MNTRDKITALKDGDTGPALVGSKREWWEPEFTDAEWCKRIREDYPEKAEEMSDDDIIDYYAEGWEIATTWDHLGDAKEACLAWLTEWKKTQALCAVQREVIAELVGVIDVMSNVHGIKGDMIAKALDLAKQLEDL